MLNSTALKIKEFTDLQAWQSSHQLVLLIYKVTMDFPKREHYALVDQLRRAASSVSANIAEGFGRYHYKERIHFYYQARGSLSEVKNFLFLSKDLDYITGDSLLTLLQAADYSRKLINGLIRSTSSVS